MGTMSYSYHVPVIGNTLVQPSFNSCMHLLNSEAEASASEESLIGAMTGIFQAGGFLDIFVTYIMEK